VQRECRAKELQVELKVRGVHLPIVVVTADDDPETRRKAQEMKAAGFFRKPVDGAALLNAIEWAVQSNSTGREREQMQNGEPHEMVGSGSG